MKKWEYMLTNFYWVDDTLRLSGLNGLNWRESPSIMGFNLYRDAYKNPLCADFLKKAGEEGWEAIGVSRNQSSTFILFKRELKN